MKEFIPLARPNITDDEILVVSQVLKSGMLVQGKYVNQLESEFAKLTGAPFASALSNGTATLHLALLTLGITTGDEVILPAFSYVATANVVELVGATPIFVDIDISTFNIDVGRIEAAITKKTKAIIPVHEFGLSCEIDAIIQIAEKHQLYVIEDAACALGALFNGRQVGGFGDFGSFSLHPRKAISSGEGGVLVTNRSDLDNQIKILRNHGIEAKDGKMDFVDFGFNYRLTDFQAALVFSQLPRLEKIIRTKNDLAKTYFNEIRADKIRLPVVPKHTRHSWQTFHVVLDKSVNRDRLVQQLKENYIGTNYGAQCIPAVTAYRRKYGLDAALLFPNALAAYERGLALPLYETLSEEQILYISNTINSLTR